MQLHSFIEALVLEPSHFDHPSDLHGIGHTYRVMTLGMHLALESGFTELAGPVLAAAFVHDMARKHDGYCTEHGRWAADQKLPMFRKFFLQHGIQPEFLSHIYTAITHHSLSVELEKEDPAYLLTALLKDADALDRIRLGPENLDPRYLRFSESRALIEPAKQLYKSTRNLKIINFTTVLDSASFTNQTQ
jgi:HD superfamily phosphodiesterase